MKPDRGSELIHVRYNMQKEKTFNLLMVIPDDRTMKGYKAPATSNDVRKAYRGWNKMCGNSVFLSKVSNISAVLV
jgi:hypothetical protein